MIGCKNLQSAIANRKSMNGPIAQLGARLNGIEKAASSNLAGSTGNRDVSKSRLCYNGRNHLKVMTGVVGHPVSEKGAR